MSGDRSWMIELAKFVGICGLIIFVAWLAETGHVGYMFVMLWVAAAFAFAVLDLVDYEIVKRRRS